MSKHLPIFFLFPASSFYPPFLVFPTTSVYLLICPVSQSPVTRTINIFINHLSVPFDLRNLYFLKWQQRTAGTVTACENPDACAHRHCLEE